MFVFPPSLSSHSALTAIAWSTGCGDNATKAYRLLSRMKDDFTSGNLSAEPSPLEYRALMSACAFNGGSEEQKSEAFRIACSALDEYCTLPARAKHKKETAEDVFALFFKASVLLVTPSEERDVAVQKAVDLCPSHIIGSPKIVKWRSKVDPKLSPIDDSGLESQSTQLNARNYS